MPEVIRSIEYDDKGRPVLVLRRKRPLILSIRVDGKTDDQAREFRVPLDDAWQYCEECYPADIDCLMGFDRFGIPIINRRTMRFEEYMGLRSLEIVYTLDLGDVTPKRMGDLAEIIQEGIDDLLKTPPQPRELVTVGEVTMTMRDLKGEGSVSYTNDLNVLTLKEQI